MSTQLPSGTLEKLWNDPANWRLTGIYVCPADPRYLVPKRIRWAGWTVNFAHPGAWIYFIVGLVLALSAAYASVLTHNAIIVGVTLAGIVAISTVSGL